MASKPLYDVMRDIVGQFGDDIVGETRFRAIVSDYMPGDNAVQRLVARAVADNVGKRLLGLRELHDQEFELRLSNLKQCFQEDNFLKCGVADYIVDCFMYSLGWSDSVPADMPEGDSGGGAQGELSFAGQDDGTEYCGGSNRDGAHSGFGVERGESSYYAGEWKLGMRNGVGMEIDTDRNRYAGEWSMNKPKGVGAKVYNDGRRYAGQWKNGNADGPGMLYLPGGLCVAGRFDRGAFVRGQGVCYFGDGSCVVGMMTENGPDGECVRFFRDGSSVAETWKGGVRTE